MLIYSSDYDSPTSYSCGANEIRNDYYDYDEDEEED